MPESRTDVPTALGMDSSKVYAVWIIKLARYTTVIALLWQALCIQHTCIVYICRMIFAD